MDRKILEQAIGATVMVMVLDVLFVLAVSLLPTIVLWASGPFGFLQCWYVGILVSMFLCWVIVPLTCLAYKAFKKPLWSKDETN